MNPFIFLGVSLVLLAMWGIAALIERYLSAPIVRAEREGLDKVLAGQEVSRRSKWVLVITLFTGIAVFVGSHFLSEYLFS